MASSQVTGLASGISWDQTIQALMQIESQPMVLLEQRKAAQENKLSAWQAINTKLLALKTAMEGMSTLDQVLTKAASSTDQDILTASADSSAATGSYSVLVNQLALGDKVIHDGFVDANTTAVTSTDGTFQYTYGTGTDAEHITLNVAAGSTLADLAQIINNDVNNPGVTATILNDGGTTNAYHLVLSGETGAVNTITAISNTLTNFANTFATTQHAQNAEIRVDGYPETTWIESASNDVSGAIAGVTLHLHSFDQTTAATVTISNDTQAATAKIQNFVDAFNEVVTLVNTDTAYDSTSKTAGNLFGDASVIGIKGSLQSIIASAVPGLQDNAAFKSLSEVGVKSGSGGMLSVDSTKLTNALQDNYTAVGDLFAFTSGSTSNNLVYFTSNESTHGGVYTVQANYDGSGNLLSATIGGNEAEIQGNLQSGYYIIGKDGNPEAGLHIKFTNPGNGPGTLTANVNIGTGCAVQIDNQMTSLTDPTEGTVHYAKDGIQRTMDSLDKQIEEWQMRLDAKQKQLTQEFTNMETLISNLKGQGQYISAMVSQL
jgi:flagellar hook-associated protein 2